MSAAAFRAAVPGRGSRGAASGTASIGDSSRTAARPTGGRFILNLTPHHSKADGGRAGRPRHISAPVLHLDRSTFVLRSEPIVFGAGRGGTRGVDPSTPSREMARCFLNSTCFIFAKSLAVMGFWSTRSGGGTSLSSSAARSTGRSAPPRRVGLAEPLREVVLAVVRRAVRAARVALLPSFLALLGPRVDEEVRARPGTTASSCVRACLVAALRPW